MKRDETSFKTCGGPKILENEMQILKGFFFKERNNNNNNNN
jgi:hypothetical protein